MQSESDNIKRKYRSIKDREICKSKQFHFNSYSFDSLDESNKNELKREEAQAGERIQSYSLISWIYKLFTEMYQQN